LRNDINKVLSGEFEQERQEEKKPAPPESAENFAIQAKDNSGVK